MNAARTTAASTMGSFLPGLSDLTHVTNFDRSVLLNGSIPDRARVFTVFAFFEALLSNAAVAKQTPPGGCFMRIAYACLFLLSAAGSPMNGLSQNATSPVTQTLQTSLQAMTASSNVQDVTLNGTAEAVAGSDDETGTFTFRATATGNSRIDLGLSNGTRSETRQPGNGSPSGSWSSGSGVSYPLAQHNLLTGYDWAFPAFVESQMLTNSSITVTFVGEEGTLLHFTATQQPAAGLSAAASATVQHLNQLDLWLSASTFLPAQLAFNIHPDNNAGMDIPVQVQYSNYQSLGGLVIPGHVQKFVNNTLALDVQIQTIAVNSGLSASTFTLQ